jgi:hypothetical protein
MAVHERPRHRDILGTAGEFWRGLSFEELARLQGVKPVERLETLLGGWPAEEVEDGFEAELAGWRYQSFRDRNGA